MRLILPLLCIALALTAAQAAEKIEAAAETRPLPASTATPTKQLIAANIAAAEHQPIPRSKKGFLQHVWEYLGSSLTHFYRHHDQLGDNIFDNGGKVVMEAIRRAYVDAEIKKHGEDETVRAIVGGNFGAVKKLLKRGVGVHDFKLYVQIASAMPNEAVLYMLVDKLIRSEAVLKLSDADYWDIVTQVAQPHIRPTIMKRILNHHRVKSVDILLRDVLARMLGSSSEIFISYLDACDEFANDFSVEEFLLESQSTTGAFLNTVLGYLYVYVKRAGDAGRWGTAAKALLKEDPPERGHIPDVLRGLAAIVEHTDVLRKYKRGMTGTSRKVMTMVHLVMQYDPELRITFQEEVIGILDMLITAFAVQKGHRNKVDPIPAMLQQRYNALPEYDIPLKLLAFGMRSGIIEKSVPEYYPWQAFGSLGPEEWRNEYQEAMVLLLNDLLRLRATNAWRPCIASRKGSGGNMVTVTHLVVGDILSDALYEKIKYADGLTLIYEMLATLFELPRHAFRVDQPLGHLRPIKHLNKRLKAYCGDAHPTVVFEGAPRDGAAIWTTTEVILDEKPAEPAAPSGPSRPEAERAKATEVKTPRRSRRLQAKRAQAPEQKPAGSNRPKELKKSKRLSSDLTATAKADGTKKLPPRKTKTKVAEQRPTESGDPSRRRRAPVKAKAR